MENKIKSKEEVNLEIELIINKSLFEKNLITEDMYKKVNEKLLKLLEKIDSRNILINNSA